MEPAETENTESRTSPLMSNEEMTYGTVLDTEEESNTMTSFPETNENNDSVNASFSKEDIEDEEEDDAGDSSLIIDTENSVRKRKKYTRKMYDINAVRTKLPRRAKDFRFEMDSDFVEVPPSPRGRGRGRRKTISTSFVAPEVVEEPAEDMVSPVATPRRGRGRGRGRGGRGGRPPKTPRTPKPRVPTFQDLEDETRMSVDNGNATVLSTPISAYRDESTNMSTQSMKKKFTREVFDASSQQPLPAIQLIEYQWPPDDPSAETWMVQEQVVTFLSIKLNFRRKYPELKRRNVDMAERNFLRDRGAVSETQADLGLTALLSREVVDLFFNDFPDKYEEYMTAQQEKKEQAYRLKPKGITATPGGVSNEKKPYDPRLRAIKAAAKWNAMFNKERLEERPCSLDMQTLVLQVSRRPTQLLPRPAVSYPVAVIPGQFSEHCRSYTPYELKCLPLGTVVRGALIGEAEGGRKRGIKKRLTQAELNSCSDSEESSSSSDDSSSDSNSDSQDSSSSSEEEDSEPEVTNVDCKVCQGNNPKSTKKEPVVRCAQCHCDGHLSCWELSADMLPQIRGYPWQCNDCKTCDYCRDPTDEDKMLFCDYCDRGYHIYCVGLNKVPEGRWHCPVCARCGSCGTADPSGGEADNKQLQWIHEYKMNSSGAKVYAVTLCGVCVRSWRNGNYCGLCNRCFDENEKNLINCSHCKKRVHENCAKKFKRTPFTCDSCLYKQKMMKKK